MSESRGIIVRMAALLVLPTLFIGGLCFGGKDGSLSYLSTVCNCCRRSGTDWTHCSLQSTPHVRFKDTGHCASVCWVPS